MIRSISSTNLNLKIVKYLQIIQIFQIIVGIWISHQNQCWCANWEETQQKKSRRIKNFQYVSIIFIYCIVNPFKNQQKTQVSSKTERKINSINSNVSGNKSTNSDNNVKGSLNHKSSNEIIVSIENLKKKVPNLRLPINIIDQHFSLTRSSRRADFSTGTTSKKLQEKSSIYKILIKTYWI